MKSFPLFLLTALLLVDAGCATSNSWLARTDRSVAGIRIQKRTKSVAAPSRRLRSTARQDEDKASDPSVASANDELEQTASIELEVQSVEKRQIRRINLEVDEILPKPSGTGDGRSERQDSSVNGAQESFPIDIVTVLRLVDANSPAIGISRARVAEARARAQAANLLWLPNLSVGASYNRFDGKTQNQSGAVFDVSRSNLFSNGGAALTLDFADAIYRPLIEQRLQAAEEKQANATSLKAQLDAILAYLDLIQANGLLAINAETLSKGEAALVAAQNAHEAKLDRTPGDVNRVRTEILLRRQERFDFQGRSNVASTRLGKFLLLSPTVRLIPEQGEIVPITIVNLDLSSLDHLVATAIQNRPDLAANRELVAAAWARVCKAQRGPLLPKLQAADQGGNFGGGINSTIGNNGGRNVLTGMLYWEIRNLGFGNHVEVLERHAGVDQANFQLAENQARIVAEVAEAAQIAEAKQQSLGVAEDAVKEANELYRITQESTFNVVDAKNLFDALRLVQALQVFQQANQNYLAAIVDHNRAQYRLYMAIGCPIGTIAPGA